MQDFVTRFENSVPSIDEVAKTMIDLKTLTSSISNIELPPHVHSKMNELLTSLMNKPDFDFEELGTHLSGSGPSPTYPQT